MPGPLPAAALDGDGRGGDSVLGEEVVDERLGEGLQILGEMVLGQAKGNQTLAAEMLGINRNTLRSKMQQLRIKG